MSTSFLRCGEVAERSKALDWNSSNIFTGVPGFESLPLRQNKNTQLRAGFFYSGSDSRVRGHGSNPCGRGLQHGLFFRLAFRRMFGADVLLLTGGGQLYLFLPFAQAALSFFISPVVTLCATDAQFIVR